MTERIVGPYLEQQILSANPLQLVNLAYRSAIQAVREARSYLERNKIPERVRAISLAHGILAELYCSLNFSAGDGEISRELGRLYDYMMRRLLDANAQAADEPLAEVLGLLGSLAAAWEQIAATPPHVPPPRDSPAMPMPSWASSGGPSADAASSRYSLSF